MVRLKPFFSYYGSKWRLSKKYNAPIYNHIIEPFAGSACYSLLHYQKEIMLYDIYDKIFQIWKYLINVSEHEILKLPLLKPGQKIPSNLAEEQKYLIGFWVSKATTRPNHKQSNYISPSGRTGKDLGFWSEKIRYRIASQLKYIRHWQIFHNSYDEILNFEATWFVDPPYQIGGKSYKYNSIDYNKLGKWSIIRNGQIIVCENGGAEWLPFRYLQTTKGMKKNTNELVYENYNIVNFKNGN